MVYFKPYQGVYRMEDTINKTNGTHREKFVKYQADQTRAEKEPELFPTPKADIVYTLADLQKVQNTEIQKTKFEKIKAFINRLLDAKNQAILNLWTMFAILFQMASHAHGLGMIFKFRNVPYSFGIILGLLGSAMFENLLHSLAVRGAFWLPTLLSILSGLFSSYAWSGFANQGNLEYWIAQGLSFIPPFVVFWLARNEYNRTVQIKRDKEIQEQKEKELLEQENISRLNAGLEPIQPEKRKRGRNLSQAEIFILVKTILEKNLWDYKKIMSQFDVGKTRAFQLLTLAHEMRIEKLKEKNVPNTEFTEKLRNLRTEKEAK
jgi:hypothetical protein